MAIGQARGPSAAASSSNEHKNSSNEAKNIAQCVLFQGYVRLRQFRWTERCG